MYVLIKPQFEVGRVLVGKGGLVKNEAARLAAVEAVRRVVEELGFEVVRTMESPVVGGDGNQEYLLSAFRK